MQRNDGLIVSFFLLYSGALITLEWFYGQTVVRHIFSDIQASSELLPDALYGLNTSFSVGLLWGTAVLFAVAWRCTRLTQNNWIAWFFMSQTLFFLALGLDDRLMLHEKIGSKLPIAEDATLILGLGLIELGLLWWFGFLRWRNLNRAHYLLYLAAIFFACMVSIDGLLPRAIPLRLSLEDLSKVWASVCLFLFAWELLNQQLHAIATQTDTPIQEKHAEDQKPDRF